MLNSRDINLLRPDVAANCRKLIDEMNALGYPVGVMTVRDDEFQLDCYKRGTGGKPPATFHSVHAGLAFDVYKNVRGQEYGDSEFFRVAGEIGKKLGFSWGGSWEKRDNPHFQWDNHKKFSNTDIKARRYPPQMPLYKEEQDDMTAEQTKAMIDEAMKAQNIIYRNLEDVPAWGKPTVQKLISRGAISGDGKGIDLSYEQLRMLVINDRMGLYGGVL